MKYIVYGSTPSSKNSKRWTGKKLINNERVMNYYKSFEELLLPIKVEFMQEIDKLEKPFELHLQFIRKDLRIFDYINAALTVQDGLVKYGVIEDDNYKVMKPVFHDVIIDKENPGVWIWVEGKLKTDDKNTDK